MKLLLATFFFVKLKIFQIEFNNFCSDINVLMGFICRHIQGAQLQMQDRLTNCCM